MPSERVLSVKAAALQLAGRRLLGLQLADEDALSMVRDSDLRDIIAKLRSRLAIKRGPQSLVSDKRFQQRLAITEIRFELADSSWEGKRRLRQVTRDAIQSGLKMQHRAKSRSDELSVLEAMIETVAQGGWQFRRFSRMAHRLYRLQREKILQSIAHPEERAGAIEELTSLYCRYFSRAVVESSPR